MLTDALPPNSRPAELARARGILAQGGIVAVPTETVYGLAADATHDRAVAAIFTAKGRPSFNPLIIHVDGVAMADTYGVLSPLAFALAEAFWPGPLSLVVPVRKGSGLAAAVTAGLPTVAVRHPKGLMADLVAMLNRPLAAPSANRSGRISPTTAAHVARDLGDAVDLILDDGPASVGLESTIVAPQDDGRIQILREGAITAAMLAPFGPVEGRFAPTHVENNASPTSPGQLLAHYAPSVPLRMAVQEPMDGEGWLTFGPHKTPSADTKIVTYHLSPTGDLEEAARRLYAGLQVLDTSGVQSIGVAPIPDAGIGRAINDRLRRAAHGSTVSTGQTTPYD